MVTLELLKISTNKNFHTQKAGELLASRLELLERLTIYFMFGGESLIKRYKRCHEIIAELRSGSETIPSLDLTPQEAQTVLDALDEPLMTSAALQRTLLLLLKLNQVVSRQQNDVLVHSEVLTIEHVLPKTLSKSWDEAFPDKEDHAEWKDRLGNLVLVNQKKNSAMGNRGFEAKCDHFKVAAAPFPLTDAVFGGSSKSWTKKSIQTQHARLLGLAAEALGMKKAK